MSDAMTPTATVCDYCWKELPPHMDACGSGDAIKCLRERAESAEALLTETRTKALEEAAAAVPSNWCDSLLTGPEGVTLPATGLNIEGLLVGVAERIRALKAEGGEK